MRSRLLTSVDHLPTINEEGPCTDVHMFNGLEEYVKSIQTLSQPSLPTADLMKPRENRSQNKDWHKTRSLLTGCEGRVLHPTQDNVTSPSILNAAQSIADPLAWLYRARGKENQDSQEARSSPGLTLQQNLQSNPLQIFTTCNLWRHNSSKYQRSEKQTQQRRKSRPQRFQKKCCSTSYTCRGALNILQQPQLPIIYEF
uniref:Uncharacterized protein n=1 Tax=Xenopus tropicalis TaxID=8364 RepID=A0A6I8QKH0_XENTR